MVAFYLCGDVLNVKHVLLGPVRNVKIVNFDFFLAFTDHMNSTSVCAHIHVSGRRRNQRLWYIYWSTRLKYHMWPHMFIIKYNTSTHGHRMCLTFCRLIGTSGRSKTPVGDSNRVCARLFNGTDCGTWRCLRCIPPFPMATNRPPLPRPPTTFFSVRNALFLLVLLLLWLLK